MLLRKSREGHGQGACAGEEPGQNPEISLCSEGLFMTSFDLYAKKMPIN